MRIIKKFLLVALVAVTLVAAGGVSNSPKTYAAANSDLQKILNDQICPKLKKIKNQNLSKKYCKNYSSQAKLDAAQQAICDKYGKRSPQSLYAACQSYDSAKKAATNAQLNAGSTCTNGKCVDAAANPDAKCDISNGCDIVAKYVNPAINLLTMAFGLIAVASIIMGGIQYSASYGDPQKVTQAKQRIINTLIAVAAYFFLYGFLQFLIPGGIF